MTTFSPVDRYADLVLSIIGGSFYENLGIVIPYRFGDTIFRIETGSADTEYGIYLNEVWSGSEISDSNGNLVIKRVLPKGEVEITILNRSDGSKLYLYVTVRDYAIWLASYAECLENIDANIIQTRNNAAIISADLETLSDVYGSAIGLYPNIGQGLEAYRKQVHELRHSYRNFGSKYQGLASAVSAITQVEPFGYSRKKWGPNWILNQSMLVNNKFDSRSSLVTKTGNITGVTVSSVEPSVLSVPAVAHSLDFDASTKTLTWSPDGSSGPATLATNGSVFLPGPPYVQPAYVLGRDTSITPFTILAGVNDFIYLNIDKRGLAAIQLTTGLPNPSVAQVAIDINYALGNVLGSYFLEYGAAYAFVASAYDNRLLIQSPVAAGSSVEVLNGAFNGAGELFSIGPRDILFAPETPISGVQVRNVLGGSSETLPIMGDCFLRLTYNGAVTPPHSLNWRSPTGVYAGADIPIPEDGIYTILDSLGKELIVSCSVSDLPSLNALETFSIGFNRYHENIDQYQGMWVSVDESNLPATNQTDIVTVYDDVIDSYPETPDYWFLNPLDLGASSEFRPSNILSIHDRLAPISSHQWYLQTSVNFIEVIGHVDKFPLIDGTPRGSNWPLNASGKLYDYENFNMKFSGWFTGIGPRTTISVQLGISFDGGDNWTLSPASLITNDISGQYILPYTYLELEARIDPEIKYRESVPLTWEDSGVLVKVIFDATTGAGGMYVVMDTLNVQVEYISSAHLGSATIPRSRHRQNFGELCWVWSDTPLSLTEQEYLGLPHINVTPKSVFAGVTIASIDEFTPVGGGSLEYEFNSSEYTKKLRWVPYGTSYGFGAGWVTILADGSYELIAPDSTSITVDVIADLLPELRGAMPASQSRSVVVSNATVNQGLTRSISSAVSSIDLFDATEYHPSTGLPLNLFGVIDEGGFSLCGMVNCDVGEADPFKYGYMYPEFESQKGEVLSLSLVGADQVATLDFHSDENQTNAILYEDGVPVPNDFWSFTDADEVSIPNAHFISGDLSLSATFTLDYDLIYQVTSTPIDLSSNLDFSDYNWLADYTLWSRFESVQGEYEITVPVYFNNQLGRAFLVQKSTQNKSFAKLEIQQGTELSEIPKRYWDFVDASTIVIDKSYLVNGQYYLTHKELRVYEQDNLGVVFEHRSAPDYISLIAESWTQIEKNEAIKVDQASPHSLHQLRISITGVRSLSDFRLRALVLKGLRLHGATPFVQGLTNVWSN